MIVYLKIEPIRIDPCQIWESLLHKIDGVLSCQCRLRLEIED